MLRIYMRCLIVALYILELLYFCIKLMSFYHCSQSKVRSCWRPTSWVASQALPCSTVRRMAPREWIHLF